MVKKRIYTFVDPEDLERINRYAEQVGCPSIYIACRDLIKKGLDAYEREMERRAERPSARVERKVPRRRAKDILFSPDIEKAADYLRTGIISLPREELRLYNRQFGLVHKPRYRRAIEGSETEAEDTQNRERIS